MNSQLEDDGGGGASRMNSDPSLSDKMDGVLFPVIGSTGQRNRFGGQG